MAAACPAAQRRLLSASLTTKDSRASKGSLAVELYDKLQRGNLVMQSKGGTRTPQGGSNLAVPASSVPKGARGVPSRLRPKNMPTAFRKGDVLYARDKKGRLTLLYVLKHQTKYRSASRSMRTMPCPCRASWSAPSRWQSRRPWQREGSRSMGRIRACARCKTAGVSGNRLYCAPCADIQRIEAKHLQNAKRATKRAPSLKACAMSEQSEGC